MNAPSWRHKTALVIAAVVGAVAGAEPAVLAQSASGPSASGPSASGSSDANPAQSGQATRDGPGGYADYSATMKAANNAYNAQDYERAAKGYRRAIQARPADADAYRNLGRTYFWRSMYPRAVAYYDMYLRVVPTDAEKGRSQVQSERRLAVSRAGESVWTMPQTRQQALAALRDQLEKGPAYTAQRGGAWGMYRTLLRTGYARPELADIRRRLAKALLDEYEGLLVADVGQPTPRLDLDDWQVQAERLKAAATLSDDPAMAAILGRRALVAKVGQAMLNGRYDEAATRASEAIKKNPDMPFLRWFRASALTEAGHYDDALAAVDDLAERLTRLHPDQLGYATVLRAAILGRMGRREDAVNAYLGLIEHTP